MRQIALVVVYGGSLTLVQDVGIAAILGGILCLSFGARAKKPALREEDGAPRPAHVSRVAGRTGSAEPY